MLTLFQNWGEGLGGGGRGYREIIGKLQYLSCKTRTDPTRAVNFVSRFVENPTSEDVKNVKRILREGPLILESTFPPMERPTSSATVIQITLEQALKGK